MTKKARTAAIKFSRARHALALVEVRNAAAAMTAFAESVPGFYWQTGRPDREAVLAKYAILRQRCDLADANERIAYSEVAYFGI